MQRLRGQKAEHIAFVSISDVYIYFTPAADTNETSFYSWPCNKKHSKLHSLLHELPLDSREGDKIQRKYLSQFEFVSDIKNCLCVSLFTCAY